MLPHVIASAASSRVAISFATFFPSASASKAFAEAIIEALREEAFS